MDGGANMTRTALHAQFGTLDRTVDPNPAAVRGDDPLTDGQSHTAAASLPIGVQTQHERIEDARLLRGWNANPLVVDAHQQAI
jgi:hypothetical protein